MNKHEEAFLCRELISSCKMHSLEVCFLRNNCAKYHCYEPGLGCSPVCHKANLLTPGCGEGKCGIYCKMPIQE